MHNLLVGKIGEDAAAKYIQSLGYTILERNFKARYAELDIVALDQNTLVCIEVKSRIGDRFGLPQEAVTPKKLFSIQRALLYYVLMHPEAPKSLRIDVISVILGTTNEVSKIEYFKNITM